MSPVTSAYRRGIIPEQKNLNFRHSCILWVNNEKMKKNHSYTGLFLHPLSLTAHTLIYTYILFFCCFFLHLYIPFNLYHCHINLKHFIFLQLFADSGG